MYICPKCKSAAHLSVSISPQAAWDLNSGISCRNCGWNGTVAEAQPKKKTPYEESFETALRAIQTLETTDAHKLDLIDRVVKLHAHLTRQEKEPAEKEKEPAEKEKEPAEKEKESAEKVEAVLGMHNMQKALLSRQCMEKFLWPDLPTRNESKLLQSIKHGIKKISASIDRLIKLHESEPVVENIEAAPPPPSKFHTFNVLDISIRHVTEADNGVLESKDSNPYIASRTGYGWVISASSTFWGDTTDKRLKVSKAFHHIMKTAEEEGFDYVWFDQDGPVYDEFPTFDW